MCAPGRSSDICRVLSECICNTDSQCAHQASSSGSSHTENIILELGIGGTVILVLKRLKQGDLEFKASLRYIVKVCLLKRKQNRNQTNKKHN